MDNIELIEKLNDFNLDEKAKKDFKDRLILLRKKQGWSQEDLAEKVDVTRQTISKWESRQTMPEVDKVIKLSKLYNLTMDELLYGEDKIETESIKSNTVIAENPNNTNYNNDDTNIGKILTDNINNINENIENYEENIEATSENKTESKHIDKVLKKYIPKILISVILIGLFAYLISVVHNFFILKEINDKFKSYKDVNNCYYERKEIVSNDTGTLYAINTKYWYKDGILKREEKRTENGITKTTILYIDTNNNIKYNISEENKEGIKRLNYTNYNELKKGILEYFIGTDYYKSNFKIIKDALFNRVSTDKDNYIVERNLEEYKKSIYNKENAFIEQSFSIKSDNEETKVIHNIQINVVTDEDLKLNLSEYNIREEN